MRRLSWLLLLFSGSVYAGAVPVTASPSVSYGSAGWASTSSATFSGGSVSGGLTTQVGGRAVTVPASWRMAANAPRIAANFVRFNPAMWAIGGLAAWLLSEGIEWAYDQWMKKSDLDASGACNQHGEVSICGYVAMDSTTACNGYEWTKHYPPGQGGAWTTAENCIWKTYSPAVQYTPINGQYPMLENRSVGQNELQPATDADWEDVATSPLPDTAADALTSSASSPLPLPLSNPIPATNPILEPLSEPYTDPVTGERWRDMAQITFAPDGRTADVQVYKQPLDANDEPDPDKPKEEEKDPCAENPDRLACIELGPVPDAPEINGKDKQVSITAQSGWGADSAGCPAPLTASFLGRPIEFSFQPVCDGADQFRPMIIGMAWVSAVVIALGIARRVS